MGKQSRLKRFIRRAIERDTNKFLAERAAREKADKEEREQERKDQNRSTCEQIPIKH